MRKKFLPGNFIFWALHRTKEKMVRCACLKVTSCFVKEQEVLASNHKTLPQMGVAGSIATILNEIFKINFLFIRAIVRN